MMEMVVVKGRNRNSADGDKPFLAPDGEIVINKPFFKNAG